MSWRPNFGPLRVSAPGLTLRGPDLGQIAGEHAVFDNIEHLGCDTTIAQLARIMAAPGYMGSTGVGDGSDEAAWPLVVVDCPAGEGDGEQEQERASLVSLIFSGGFEQPRTSVQVNSFRLDEAATSRSHVKLTHCRLGGRLVAGNEYALERDALGRDACADTMAVSCAFVESETHGVECSRGGSVVLRSCDIRGNAGDGIVVQAGGKLTAEADTRIVGCSGDGLYVKGRAELDEHCIVDGNKYGVLAVGNQARVTVARGAAVRNNARSDLAETLGGEIDGVDREMVTAI